MATQSRQNDSQTPPRNRGQAFIIGLLIGIGSIALANWLVLRWMNVYLFDTQNYVETVAPLTKDPEVASALSRYATIKLYSSIDVEREIKEALPERAAFLAAPLAGQVVSATEKIGTNIIASDQFNSIWIAANETAHARLINTLEKPRVEFDAEKERIVYGVNISPFLEKIRERLQSSETGVLSNSPAGSQAAEVAVDLRNKIQSMRAAYQYTQALYVLLPMLTIASYLGAIAVARRRRWHVTFAIALTVVVITALELIILKAARPEIISQVATPYQAAAGVIWDALSAGFKTVTTNALIIGVITSILVMFAGPFSWAKKFRSLIGLDKLSKTRFFEALRHARNWVRKTIVGWRVAGVVIAFAALILKPAITWQTIIQAVLAYLIYVSIVELLASRKK